jgi:hypothetical protein
MKKLAAGLGALGVVIGGVFGGLSLASAGEGHTPVVVCHWVPAAPAGNHLDAGPDGGSYVVIVVDDDAANGNRNLRAHAHHPNDIIGQDGNCGGVEED